LIGRLGGWVLVALQSGAGGIGGWARLVILARSCMKRPGIKRGPYGRRMLSHPSDSYKKIGHGPFRTVPVAFVLRWLDKD